MLPTECKLECLKWYVQSKLNCQQLSGRSVVSLAICQNCSHVFTAYIPWSLFDKNFLLTNWFLQLAKNNLPKIACSKCYAQSKLNHHPMCGRSVVSSQPHQPHGRHKGILSTMWPSEHLLGDVFECEYLYYRSNSSTRVIYFHFFPTTFISVHNVWAM